MMHSKRGFTLVELSIVLVILGLLIGGVLTGQSLIRAAELRAVSTQYSRYITATQTFRDKYLALPGDLSNAQSYWGAATNCPGTSSQPSTTAATCNGDGNGKIDVSANANENFRFWQHLANAGLIEGNYSGVDGGTNTYTAIGANSPAGKISSSLWNVHNYGTITSNASMFDAVYGNTFGFGGLTANDDPRGMILKPEDAYNIDTKMDDGKPGSGKILARENMNFTGTYCSTATASSMTSATYLLTNTVLSCTLLFPQAF